MRSIIHSDMNSFYASVEQAENPALRGLPLVVGGHEESRHGIVLAASREAKAAGVKTAMALWEARRACPGVVIVPPHYELYHRYSRMARAIYYDYTDRVEPFGPDEAWLDVTDSAHLFGGSAVLIAREISERVKRELGLRVSVGVSYNKIYAKFGSDYRKPDGFTVVSPDSAMDLVWPAPVSDLLYVGPATTVKLAKLSVFTIGDLARAPTATLVRRLGKMGMVLQEFARGNDRSEVRPLDLASTDVRREIKSVGNGVTSPFDIDDPRTARQVVWLLGESVAQRLRALGLRGRCVSVSARDAETLASASRQTTLPFGTNITEEVCSTAYSLLERSWSLDAEHPLRGLVVRVSRLEPDTGPVQLDLYGRQATRLRKKRLDEAIDELRHRYGNHAVRRLGELTDERIATLDPERDNVTHPVSFFG
jgi:DNA polymerase-4